MFNDILEFIAENKTKNFGKTVLKMRSQLCEKIAYVSTKILLEKSEQTDNKKKWKRLQSLADSGDKTSSSRGFLIPHLKNSVP